MADHRMRRFFRYISRFLDDRVRLKVAGSGSAYGRKVDAWMERDTEMQRRTEREQDRPRL